MKKCSYRTEEIQDEPIKSIHCGDTVTSGPQATTTTTSPPKPGLALLKAIGVLLLIAGCSKNPTATDEPQRRKPADAPKRESAEVQEAIKQAVKCAQKHWTTQDNGSLWFGYVELPNDARPRNAQFKPVTGPQATPEELSEADRLNGIEWRGAVNFSAAAHRTQFDDKSWNEWKPWNLKVFWSVKAEKRNGAWSAEEQKLLLARTRDGEITFGWYSVTSSKPTDSAEQGK